jgi:hypothetical protein
MPYLWELLDELEEPGDTFSALSVTTESTPEPEVELEATTSPYGFTKSLADFLDDEETNEPEPIDSPLEDKDLGNNMPSFLIPPSQRTENEDLGSNTPSDDMSLVGRAAYKTGKFFEGSGIPTAIAGLTSWYFAQNERIGDLLGLKDFEGVAKAKKEYWDALRKDFQVEGLEESVIDKPLLLLDPRWYNYQINKMVPAIAAGYAVGGPLGAGRAAGSLVTGATMSLPETALVFDEVLKETGDKQAAYTSSMYNFAINTTLESFGFSRLLSVTGKPLTRYTKGAITEGGTEFSQNLLNDIQQMFWTEAAKGFSVPEITEKIRQEFPQMFKEATAAGVAGGAIGGVFGVASPGVRNDARQTLKDLGVPEDLLVEPEVEIDPDSEIGKVMRRLEVENSIVDTQQTATEVLEETPLGTAEEVPTATEVLEETPLETLPTEQSPQGTATEQRVQQPTETQEAVEADPRLESVLKPLEETQPDISAVKALEEAVEAAPLETDQELSTRRPGEPLSLEVEEATDVAPTVFSKEEMSLISKEENPTVTKLVEFLDNNEKPGQVPLLKLVNKAVVGSRPSKTPGRGDVDITVADKIREHFAEKLGPEEVKGTMASLFQKVGREDFTQAVRDIIQTEREKIVGPYRERQGTQGNLVDSSVKGLGGVQDTGLTRDIDTPTTPTTLTTPTTPNTPSIHSPLPDPSISISQSSQPYSPRADSTITEQQGDKTTKNIFPPEEESTSSKDDTSRAPITPDELRLVRDREDKEAISKLENSQNLKQASDFLPIAKALGIHDRLIQKASEESSVADKNEASLLNRLGVTRVRELMYESLFEHRRDQVLQNRADAKPTGKPEVEESHKRDGEVLTEEQKVKAGEKFVEGTDKYMETNDPDKAVKDSEREKFRRELKTKFQRAFQESMSILEGINPRLAGLMKRFEAAVMNNTVERLVRGSTFFKVYRSLDPRERQLMKKAWVNYHKPDARKTIDDYSAQNPEFGKAFAEARAIVDEITGEAMATGIIGKNREHYLPARVRDLDGLLTFIAEHAKPEKQPVAKELRDVIEESPSATSITSMMSEYLGREVKTYEEAKAEFSKLLERGFLPTMFLNPSSAKGRQIWNVTDGMLAFYYNPAESLELHIKEMTEAIEQRKLVGVSRKGKYQDRLDTLTRKPNKEPKDYDRIRSLQQAIAAEDSMDRLTEDLTDVVTKATLEGGISIRDQKMAIDVFKDRFNQKRLSRPLASLKDLSLASALGQGLSTITQLADAAPMIIRQGFWNSIEAMNADKSFKKEDIDMNSANTEWANSSKTSKFLDGLLTGTGFKAVDSFFATASMEAALIRAKKASWGEFNKNYKHIFGNDTKQLFDDIQNGKKTKLAKEFAVIELSETRPLFPTNMPPSFLVGGEARILYALKSWNLKTANNIYRNIRKAHREGGMPKATYVGLKNIAVLALAGAGADAIKDLLLGNPVELDDTVLDNLLKIVFLSRYSLGKFSKGDFDGGLADYVSPPLNYLKRPYQDIKDIISEDGKFTFETLKEMPAVGRVLHARFTPYGQKARLDKEREAIFGLLKEATLEKDRKLMVEFHKKRRAYNEKVRSLKQKGGFEELKTIGTESISRARNRYRAAEKKKKRSTQRAPWDE